MLQKVVCVGVDLDRFITMVAIARKQRGPDVSTVVFVWGVLAVATNTATLLQTTAAAAAAAAPPPVGATARARVPLPFYTGPAANNSKPLSGFQKVRAEFNVGVFFGSAERGFYNHAAMWHYHDTQFTLSWKNAPVEEDTPGQRVLCVSVSVASHVVVVHCVAVGIDLSTERFVWFTD